MTPKISSAEWEVMSVVWEHGPQTGAEIFAALPPGHGWKPKTVNTFLTRLVTKGILAADRQGKAFTFRARATREKCVQAESSSFLQRVFRGATGDLVLHFCDQANLTTAELAELEELIRNRRNRP